MFYMNLFLIWEAKFDDNALNRENLSLDQVLTFSTS